LRWLEHGETCTLFKGDSLPLRRDVANHPQSDAKKSFLRAGSAVRARITLQKRPDTVAFHDNRHVTREQEMSR
jgi:hypothetical protein